MYWEGYHKLANVCGCDNTPQFLECGMTAFRSMPVPFRQTRDRFRVNPTHPRQSTTVGRPVSYLYCLGCSRYRIFTLDIPHISQLPVDPFSQSYGSKAGITRSPALRFALLSHWR